ncbi:NADH-quinone oxidoreductase subunit M [Salinibacter ruber]|uniref:complex I subunit 4 family protein n=1 Tax=Salinibacter ruber TaxID=146919 RepID=UPI002167FFFD|nr:NADH-quinone oxidoreductase subunit M [Salinibacter ruber]MCS3663136.1 NADH-quinone oxidoreductase subunit M [Salinibacter ruber]
MDIPYLTSLVVFLPAAGALLTLFLRRASAIRWTALATTTVTFVLSIGLFVGYDPSVSTALGPQLADVWAGWLPDGYDVKYFVGVDGLSLLLVMLTTLLGPIVVLSSWTYIGEKHKGYYALLLLLQTGITGVFTSFDLLLFYIFFELTLIPMYFIIGIWGGKERIYAAVKFVIYTLVGSLLMLVGILYLGYAAGDAVNNGVFTTDWYTLLEYNIPLAVQGWLFAVFAFSFAIKVPLFPLHTWLPDAHVQAPTGGSVILAGVLLKMGTYGLLRFCLPLFPNVAQSYASLFAVIAIIGIIYGALVARVQDDAKSLVAYSSISHLGFVVLGLFAFTTEAMQGAMIQMVNHGLSTGALFLLVGMLYERRHTRLMDDYGGLATSVPVLTTLMVISVLASAGLPGLNGFVGEFLILLGSFKSTVIDSPVLIAFATTGVILAAMYLLHMVYRTFFGELTDAANAQMADLNAREFGLMVPLIVLMFVLGFYPGPFLRQTAPTTEFLLETVEEKRAAVERMENEAAATADEPTPVPTAPPEAEDVSIDVPSISP